MFSDYKEWAVEAKRNDCRSVCVLRPDVTAVSIMQSAPADCWMVQPGDVAYPLCFLQSEHRSWATGRKEAVPAVIPETIGKTAGSGVCCWQLDMVEGMPTMENRLAQFLLPEPRCLRLPLRQNKRHAPPSTSISRSRSDTDSDSPTTC